MENFPCHHGLVGWAVSEQRTLENIEYLMERFIDKSVVSSVQVIAEKSILNTCLKAMYTEFL